MKIQILAILAMLAVLSIGAASSQAQTTDLVETFMNQDPDPAEPGKYVELRWQVQKTGNNNVNNVEYFLEVEYPFSFDGTDTPERNLGNIGGAKDSDEFFTLFYKVLVDDNAIEGTYDVFLKKRAGFTDTYITKEYEVRVGDDLRPEFVIGQISSSPTKLSSDIDEAKLEVDIANIGNGAAENVLVKLNLPEGFSPSYSYSDREALGTILMGSTKTATFFMDIEEVVSGGVHDASLTIEYKEADDDKNELKTKVIKLEIPLKEKPLFKIERIESVPSAISPGNMVSLKVFITNIGGEEADSVSLRAFKESTQPFDFEEKSDFIGKLLPGETGEAILKIDIDPTASRKTYILDVEVRGVDDDEVIVQDEIIELSVNGGSSDAPFTGNLSAGMSPLLIGGFVVVLAVVGFFAYRYGKSRPLPK